MNRREGDTDVLYQGDEATARQISEMLSDDRGIPAWADGGTVRVRRFELKSARIAVDALLDQLSRSR